MWSPVWIWESEIPHNICNQIINCSSQIKYENGLTQSGDNGRKVNINCNKYWIFFILFKNRSLSLYERFFFKIDKNLDF